MKNKPLVRFINPYVCPYCGGEIELRVRIDTINEGYINMENGHFNIVDVDHINEDILSGKCVDCGKILDIYEAYDYACDTVYFTTDVISAEFLKDEE